MSFKEVTPAQPETFKSLQLDGTAAQTADINQALDNALEAGLLLRADTEGITENGERRWRVRLLPVIGDEQIGEPGCWLVVSSLGPVYIKQDVEYRARFGLEVSEKR